MPDYGVTLSGWGFLLLNGLGCWLGNTFFPPRNVRHLIAKLDVLSYEPRTSPGGGAAFDLPILLAYKEISIE